MKDKCPFQHSNRCDIWVDYQVLQCTVVEAEELAAANWSEIQHLYDYIDRLKSALRDAGIQIPLEY